MPRLVFCLVSLMPRHRKYFENQRICVRYGWYHRKHECGAAAASTTLGKANLAQTAFGTVFGESFGNIFVAICLFFFAFSTVLGWNLFGRINANYLFGRKNKKLCNTIYTIIALVFIFLGTLTGNDFVWELTDMFNNLIVLPNALALFALTGMVVAMLKEGQQSKLKV